MGEIPESAKHPLSLEADYADPRIYCFLSKIVGIFIAAMGVVFLAATLNIIVSLILFTLGFIFYKLGSWIGKQR